MCFFFLMIRRPPRSTQSRSSAASDVYKRQVSTQSTWGILTINTMNKTALFLILTIAGCALCLTAEQLKKVMPNASSAKLGAFSPHLDAAMKEAQINTCARQSAFLAQLAQESGELAYMEELASGAEYEGRRDLGNTQPGDGKRFKGRGPIQLTGRNNYRAAGKALGLDLEGNPAQVATPQVGFKVATWFWNSRGLSSFADKNNQAAFDQITLRVNGCINCAVTHKANRDSYWRKAKQALGCQVHLFTFLQSIPFIVCASDIKFQRYPSDRLRNSLESEIQHPLSIIRTFSLLSFHNHKLLRDPHIGFKELAISLRFVEYMIVFLCFI
eukprot:TRINITY_DN1412_c0_g2_i4.p1 TRINITY_DN1412_c0_g2~~TRINITY_DN1412_c0_g2_i4.p1  ORF type:complete len:328 (-),score=99.24 TRINITY_DN1412_c0_g2_i4:31-1014(-)